jgi:biotin carboxyl carrier protein
MSGPRPRVVVRSVTRDGGTVVGCVQIEGIDDPVDVRHLGDGTYQVTLDGRRFEVVVARGPDADWGHVDGRNHRWPRRPEGDDALPASDDDAPIVAATPGTVTAVAVVAGQTVKRGDTLVVLEAMKMEIPLRAPRHGRVATVCCVAGETVEAGVPLVVLEAPDEIVSE